VHGHSKLLGDIHQHSSLVTQVLVRSNTAKAA
jgi:hypothetical protein